jgi:RES domain-containing protein
MTLDEGIYHPDLLDFLEQHEVAPWRGSAWRHVFEDTDPLRANIAGARWNPPGEEALYTSLELEAAIAEVDHLVRNQPYPILRPRLNYRLEVELSRVVDLSSRDVLEGVLEDLGLDWDALSGNGVAECRRIGGAAAWRGFGGVLVPSIRHPAINLVIFVNRAGPDDVWNVVEGPEPYVPPAEL